MSTRAIQLGIFQAGFRDPSTDNVLSGGSAEFYVADGNFTTPKDAYEDILKASTITSVTLNSFGQYPTGLYFDGSNVYDIRIKDSVGTVKYNLTNVKIPDNTSSVVTKTANYTATVDDDAILGDTTGGAFVITLPLAALSVKPITVKNIGTGGNSLTIDGNGTELIDGAGTAALVNGAALTLFSDGSAWHASATTTGVNYTTTNFISGEGITFEVAGSTTTVSGGTPTGMVAPFAMDTPPTGWLECDGTAVNRTTYAALFTAIGVRFGIGDGSTTFNVPDLRGQFLRGYDNGAGNDPDAASRTDSGDGTTGDNVGTVQADAMQGHHHILSGPLTIETGDVLTSVTGGGASSGIEVTVSAGAPNTVISVDDPSADTVPSGTPRTSTETRSKNISMMYCIKV